MKLAVRVAGLAATMATVAGPVLAQGWGGWCWWHCTPTPTPTPVPEIDASAGALAVAAAVAALMYIRERRKAA
jgi:crotonobetainyl-CoA:carnitine CoA-transferase CaiB-like acyl-CoA transferase